MKKEEVQKLIKVRTFLLENFKKLDFRENLKTAIISQDEHGRILERSIKDIDEFKKMFSEVSINKLR